MGFRLKNVVLHELKNREQVLELAKKLKSYGGTECEREEKENRKRKIKAKILGQEMRPFTWAVGEVNEPGANKGLSRRVDGQHSSEVFLDLAPEEWERVAFPVIVTWEEHECESMVDLAILFEQFNPPWSSRNKQDLIGAHFGIHEDLLPMIGENGPGRHVADKVTKGMEWYERNVNGRSKVDSRQFELIHENHDTHAFILWCGSFLQKRKTEEMLHQVVIAAMRHTFNGNDPSTSAFWKQVAGGRVTNEDGTPAYKLAVFLEYLSDPEAEWPQTIKKHFKPKNAPTPVQIFATCLNAWNGDRTGKRLGDIFDPAKGKTVKEIAAAIKPEKPDSGEEKAAA